MSWLWWLLAPVASTVLGGTGIWWWGVRERRAAGRPRNAMTEHHTLLSALPQQRLADPLPVTVRVLDN